MKSKTKASKGKDKTLYTAEGPMTLLPVPNQPVIEALHGTEDPGARLDHGSASRAEIRKTVHRKVPSRQSQRPVERSNQARKKRG